MIRAYNWPPTLCVTNYTCAVCSPRKSQKIFLCTSDKP